MGNKVTLPELGSDPFNFHKLLKRAKKKLDCLSHYCDNLNMITKNFTNSFRNMRVAVHLYAGLEGEGVVMYRILVMTIFGVTNAFYSSCVFYG